MQHVKVRYVYRSKQQMPVYNIRIADSGNVGRLSV